LGGGIKGRRGDCGRIKKSQGRHLRKIWFTILARRKKGLTEKTQGREEGRKEEKKRQARVEQ